MLGRPAMEVDDYVGILRRRWLWIVIPAILAPVITFVISLKLPEKYVSLTLVLVEQQKVPEGYVKPVVNEDLNARLASMREQILSRTRLQPLIERFGLYDNDHDPMEQKLETMRKAIDIKMIRPEVSASRANGLPGFYISFSADHPKMAQQVCGEITSLFLSENLKAREQSAAGTTAFLTTQLEEAKRSLDEQDEKLAAFQRKYIGRLPGQEQTNLNMLASLNTQLEAATQEINRLEQQKTYNEALIAEQANALQLSKQSAKPVKAPDREERTVEALQQLLLSLRSKYTDDHPDVIRVKRDLENLKNNGDAEEVNGNPVAKNEEPEPPALQQRRAAAKGIDTAIRNKRNDQQRWQEQISTYQHRLEASPTIEEEHKKLTRDYQSALQFYNDLLAKKNQSEMATDLERRQQGEQFRVMDPPNLPERPTFPNRPLFAAGGLIGGLVLGLGLVGLLEWRDKSVRTVRDAELWLKLPVLGVIPEFALPGETEGQKVERKKLEKAAKLQGKQSKLGTKKPTMKAVQPPTTGASSTDEEVKPGVEAHV